MQLRPRGELASLLIVQLAQRATVGQTETAKEKLLEIVFRGAKRTLYPYLHYNVKCGMKQ